MKALVVGGYSTAIRGAWGEHLRRGTGIEVGWVCGADNNFKGMPSRLPKGCEVVLVISDGVGHMACERAKQIASHGGVRCELVSRHASKTVESLVQRGYIAAVVERLVAGQTTAEVRKMMDFAPRPMAQLTLNEDDEAEHVVLTPQAPSDMLFDRWDAAALLEVTPKHFYDLAVLKFPQIRMETEERALRAGRVGGGRRRRVWTADEVEAVERDLAARQTIGLSGPVAAPESPKKGLPMDDRVTANQVAAHHKCILSRVYSVSNEYGLDVQVRGSAFGQVKTWLLADFEPHKHRLTEVRKRGGAAHKDLAERLAEATQPTPPPAASLPQEPVAVSLPQEVVAERTFTHKEAMERLGLGYSRFSSLVRHLPTEQYEMRKSVRPAFNNHLGHHTPKTKFVRQCRVFTLADLELVKRWSENPASIPESNGEPRYPQSHWSRTEWPDDEPGSASEPADTTAAPPPPATDARAAATDAKQPWWAAELVAKVQELTACDVRDATFVLHGRIVDLEHRLADAATAVSEAVAARDAAQADAAEVRAKLAALKSMLGSL